MGLFLFLKEMVSQYKSADKNQGLMRVRRAVVLRQVFVFFNIRLFWPPNPPLKVYIFVY